ncbi:MAG: hypothetical protein KDD33_09060 [Bdellovibrionales bacterium]|nr:hypothetical protein [Bdellovibrionales bacterium]
MKRLALTLIFISCLPSVTYAGGLHESLRQGLAARKASYEQFMKSLKTRDIERLANADKQKVIRQHYQEKMEKARLAFERVEAKKSRQAYLNFVKIRDQRQKNREQDRRYYQAQQESLRETREKSRYKINKMEEYQL